MYISKRQNARLSTDSPQLSLCLMQTKTLICATKVHIFYEIDKKMTHYLSFVLTIRNFSPSLQYHRTPYAPLASKQSMTIAIHQSSFSSSFCHKTSVKTYTLISENYRLHFTFWKRFPYEKASKHALQRSVKAISVGKTTQERHNLNDITPQSQCHRIPISMTLGANYIDITNRKVASINIIPPNILNNSNLQNQLIFVIFRINLHLAGFFAILTHLGKVKV